MSYVYRIKCRIKEDGLKSTLIYIGYVCCYTIGNLIKDTYLDLKYSNRLLHGNQKTLYRHMGANDTYHTGYTALSLIFKKVAIRPDDVLVDVGCGKGRVINYWLSQKYINPIWGLELDPQIAKQTEMQFNRYNNVKVIPGDAIENLPDQGTVFYFYNPFSLQKVIQFEEKISSAISGKPVTIIYYNPKSIEAFQKEPWKITWIDFERDLNVKRWGRIHKYHDLAVIASKTQGTTNYPRFYPQT